MVALIPYSVEQADTIYRLPQINARMGRNPTLDTKHYDIAGVSGHSTDGARIYVDRNLLRWQWLDKWVNVVPYLFLRELTASSIMLALHELTDHDLEALLGPMRMVNKHDSPFEHASGVGAGVMDYAVRLQYGPSGLEAYRRFLDSQVKAVDKCRVVPKDM